MCKTEKIYVNGNNILMYVIQNLCQVFIASSKELEVWLCTFRERLKNLVISGFK